MDTSGGKNIVDTLIGQRAPESGTLGASPADVGGRLIAAGAHLLYPALMSLAAVIGLATESPDDGVVALFYLLVLAFLLLLGLSRAARARFPVVSFHANQTHWWLLVMAVLLAIAVIPAAALASATGSDAVGIVIYLPLVGAIIAPSVIAAYRVFVGEGHRYPFVAANLEAGKRWREE